MQEHAFCIRIQFYEPLRSEQTHLISPQDQEKEHFSTLEAPPYYFCYYCLPLRVTVVS